MAPKAFGMAFITFCMTPIVYAVAFPGVIFIFVACGMAPIASDKIPIEFDGLYSV